MFAQVALIEVNMTYRKTTGIAALCAQRSPPPAAPVSGARSLTAPCTSRTREINPKVPSRQTLEPRDLAGS